jgi:hypothetical protein
VSVTSVAATSIRSLGQEAGFGSIRVISPPVARGRVTTHGSFILLEIVLAVGVETHKPGEPVTAWPIAVLGLTIDALGSRFRP